MDSWGKKRDTRYTGPTWEPLDAVPSIAPTGLLPTASVAFGVDLLEEIDSLLHNQDLLIGFWQAPGE